jgi:DNA-binding CsgD family transcriptional regulator
VDEAAYDDCVAKFYRAATGSLDWNQALETVRLNLHARCIPVQTHDRQTGRVISAYPGGPEMDRPALDYFKKYHLLDPRARLAVSTPPLTWIHCHEHFDDEFVAKDCFYQEFLTSFDSRYVSGIVIPLDPKSVAIFGVQLPASRGPLNPEDRAWVRRLGEHLREALLAYERVRRMAAEALAGHKLLQVFPYPMWLMSADRFIFYANPEAVAEQQAEKLVTLRGARFALCDTRADHVLTTTIAALQGSDHGSSSLVDLRLRSSDPPIWLHLSHLLPSHTLMAFGERPQILATLFDPRRIRTLDPFALSNMFRLTPAEAKVAAQIANGLRAEDIARANGTRIGTVRSQINAILQKFGTTRQTEVVRILRQGEALWAQASSRCDQSSVI